LLELTPVRIRPADVAPAAGSSPGNVFLQLPDRVPQFLEPFGRHRGTEQVEGAAGRRRPAQGTLQLGESQAELVGVALFLSRAILATTASKSPCFLFDLELAAWPGESFLGKTILIGATSLLSAPTSTAYDGIV
jgi:hypothetical protein